MGSGDGRLAGNANNEPIVVVCKFCDFQNVFATHYEETCGNPDVPKHLIQRIAGKPNNEPMVVVCKFCGFQNVFATHYEETCGNPGVPEHLIQRK
jgi:RNase P subunit RPR2